MKKGELENKLSQIFEFIQNKNSISKFKGIEKITKVSMINKEDLLVFLRKNKNNRPNTIPNEKFKIIYVKKIEVYNENNIYIEGKFYTPYYNFERAKITFTNENDMQPISNNLLIGQNHIIRKLYKIR